LLRYFGPATPQQSASRITASPVHFFGVPDVPPTFRKESGGSAGDFSNALLS
jgi:hypothetical protein